MTHAPAPGFVEKIPLKTAKEFLETVSPSSSIWGTDDPQDWVFRGHSDHKFKLIPSALRAGDILLKGIWEPGPMKDARTQRQAEFELIQRFFRLADAQGLPIPEDNHQLRVLMNAQHPDDARSWPPREIYALVALAQHYGIPTRMLDWTRKPLVAAYFAAAGAAKAVKKAEKEGKVAPGRLAVWALRRRMGKIRDLPAAFGIEIVLAPRASNPNMHLQSGLFTLLVDNGKTLDKAPNLRTLERVIRRATPSGVVAAPVLREITLPVKEAPKLMRILRNNFIQAATIYAGYDGVKQSVFETKYRG